MLYVSYKYCLAFYVLAKDPSLGVRQTVKLAVQTIKGYKRKRFLLDLSFIGWFLLLIPVSLVTCGVGLYIGILFLAPYVYAAQAVQFCDITGIVTVRHDLENPYEAYAPYQGFGHEQSNTVENEDIKDNSGENSTEE